MDWFGMIKRYHEKGWWTTDMVKLAVVMKKITEEEFKEITGEDYVPDESA
ncbi:MAG: XkdX family protein [Bacillus sp. (in: firmicutes)]